MLLGIILKLLSQTRIAWAVGNATIVIYNFGLKMRLPIQDRRRWRPWEPRRNVNSPQSASDDSKFFT